MQILDTYYGTDTAANTTAYSLYETFTTGVKYKDYNKNDSYGSNWLLSTKLLQKVNNIKVTGNYEITWDSEAKAQSNNLYHTISTWGDYNNSITSSSGYWSCSPPRVLTPAERLREIMRSRHAPAFVSTRKPMRDAGDIREQRARETLRRVVGDAKFRSFLKTGFVTVQGPSGLTYQIFPGHGITRVYDHGKPVEKLCVVLRGDFAPTDSVITRFLMLLNDEAQFRSLAIRSDLVVNRRALPEVDIRSLLEIFTGLQLQAA